MEWTTLKQRTAAYFSEGRLVRGVTPDDILNMSLDRRKLFAAPIDWSWGATDADIDRTLNDAGAAYLLRCNQVESFISEAGTLIERSLSDLMKYDELNIERFKLLMEFVQFFKTWDQQLAEQNDADYWQGLAAEQDLLSQARIKASGNKPTMDQNYTNAAVAYKGAMDILWDQGNSGDTARLPLAAQRDTIFNTQAQYDAQVDANQLESSSLTTRKKYELRSRFHQLKRQDITREIIGLKIQEFQDHLGALNYNERMLEIGKRAKNDFVEVFARLKAIVLGLREFYDITDPSEAELNDDLANSRTRIEGAVTWLRKAANALGRAKMDEEGTIVRVTVEHDSSRFLRELKHGVTVHFPATFVPNMERVQLRGLSATAEFNDNSWIDLEITSPPQKLDSAEITLPAVVTRLGRVCSAKSLNIRDVAGVRPIVNRSPIGDWKVRCIRDHLGQSVRRVDLDFQLAFVRA